MLTLMLLDWLYFLLEKLPKGFELILFQQKNFSKLYNPVFIEFMFLFELLIVFQMIIYSKWYFHSSDYKSNTSECFWYERKLWFDESNVFSLLKCNDRNGKYCAVALNGNNNWSMETVGITLSLINISWTIFYCW